MTTWPPLPEPLDSVSSELLIGGSFVIAAISRTGIVVVSETRANIFDKTDTERRPIAYYDGIQKIFRIGSHAIAETGQGLILNVFFSAVVRQFKKALRILPTVDQLLPVFLDYCQQTFPPAFVQQMRTQKLFSAGYSDSHPSICYFNEQQGTHPFGCIRDTGFIQSSQTTLSDYADQLPTLSVKQVTELAKQAIESYASQDDRWKTIGGPTDVLLVTRNGCRWLEKHSSTGNWTYIQDLVRDHRAGQVKIHPIPPATSKQLDDLLATVSEEPAQQ
jgi:hypothetical protein